MSESSAEESPLDVSALKDLMEKLQIRPPEYLDTDSLISNVCEKVIEDEGTDSLEKEAAKLEQKVIRIILSGKGSELLKPNSGQSVEVGGHHICVGCSERAESGYNVWQWHGHIMLFDDEDGFRLEYVYGNYFQKLKKDERDTEEEEEEGLLSENSVLRELMEKADEINARILCRNIALAAKR
eukprot:TRINITY_DN22261_c0_g1_i1.p1 TRINITY_DN22261_c0_g1~~TRINITY_DN22261_c0_g1_i1.p1  ORF type:complete len:183 (+),score=27.97 TRINITY_DN22261_c0_g1_i1:149-697(+)